MFLAAAGCSHVSGNYPPLWRPTNDFTARLAGEGFLLLAGSRLGLDRVEAELGQLRSQGFSRRDPQIIKSVARRRNVPAALVADRTGCSYYRFTAQLGSGTHLTLAPGSLEITVETGSGTVVVRDQGFLLVDPRHPGGCRPPSQTALAFGASNNGEPVAEEFLVRLPVRGEIVGLSLVPHFDPQLTPAGEGAIPP
jgi:hypothetical protein